MKKSCLALLFLLAAVIPANTQTVSRTLSYDFLLTTPAEVNTYIHTVKIDTAAATQITPTCTLVGATTTCTNPITLTSGTHTIVVEVTNTAGNKASGTLAYDPGANPFTPTNIKIIIKITVP